MMRALDTVGIEGAKFDGSVKSEAINDYEVYCLVSETLCCWPVDSSPAQTLMMGCLQDRLSRGHRHEKVMMLHSGEH